MTKFWDNNKTAITEDVTSDRKRGVAEPVVGTKRLNNAKSIEVEQIEADPQHREEFDEEKLKDLAGSISKHGQLQPIRVRWDAERGRYVIIAGERRWRATKLAGLKSIDCIVADGQLSDSEILREQILENAIREDLKPTEQGRAFDALMAQEGWNGKQLAEELHISPSTVSRALGLLKLPQDIQAKVDRGVLPIVEALKGGEKPAPKQASRKRPSKQKKITTSVGITVMLKARKILKDEQIATALREALAELEAAA